MLMTLISALHNLSRSVGCALLAAAGNKGLILYFVGGEMLFYLACKLARGDFIYWVRVGGLLGNITACVERICVKIIVDFTGCLHMRHPYELGKPGAQGFENNTTSAIT